MRNFEKTYLQGSSWVKRILWFFKYYFSFLPFNFSHTLLLRSFTTQRNQIEEISIPPECTHYHSGASLYFPLVFAITWGNDHWNVPNNFHSLIVFFSNGLKRNVLKIHCVGLLNLSCIQVLHLWCTHNSHNKNNSWFNRWFDFYKSEEPSVFPMQKDRK